MTRRATDQTALMIAWWNTVGLDRVDLAVRRADGSMLWHRDLVLTALPLAWARAENVRHADIYLRPARGHAWPVAFVDDVAVDRARRVARDTGALVIETSPAGGCHLWIACDHPLAEVDRAHAQRWWVRQLDADPGSVSGEHLGRLAGFKNWKRGGCWVNVLVAPRAGCPWNPTVALAHTPSTVRRPPAPWPRTDGGDTSPSGCDWAWVCTRLEAGHAASRVYDELITRCRPRRGADAERYAQRTVEQAQRHVASRTGLIPNDRS
jgi:hypothetical protein